MQGGSKVRATRATHKDGRKLYVDLSFSVIRSDSDTVLGALAIGRDCTARFLAERGAPQESP